MGLPRVALTCCRIKDAHVVSVVGWESLAASSSPSRELGKVMVMDAAVVVVGLGPAPPESPRGSGRGNSATKGPILINRGKDRSDHAVVVGDNKVSVNAVVVTPVDKVTLKTDNHEYSSVIKAAEMGITSTL